MKNVVLCCVLVFMSVFVFAETVPANAENLTDVVSNEEAKSELLPFTFGLQIGGNMENEDGYAFVLGAYADYEIFKTFKAGFQFTYSSDFDNIFALDPVAYAKWNIEMFKFSVLQKEIVPYVKGNLGLMFMSLNNFSVMNVLYGADIGLTLKLDKFLIEPYLSIGYPYMWGFGISGGYSLK